MNNRKTGYQKSKREKILSVAGRLFWERGYLATSVDDLAAAARVNKATIYYHFLNKSEILYEVVSRAADAFIANTKLDANLNLVPKKKLQRLVTNFVMWETSHPGLAALGQAERRNLPYKLGRAYIQRRDDVEALFQRVIAEVTGEVDPQNENTRLTTRFVMGLLNSITQWYKRNGKLSAQEIASQAYKFISLGLRLTAIGCECVSDYKVDPNLGNDDNCGLEKKTSPRTG